MRIQTSLNSKYAQAIVASATLGSFVLAGQASAQDQINLLDFLTAPASADVAEFVYDGTNFSNGPGTVGSGDGNLPIEDQDGAGLLATSPFDVSSFTGGIPGAVTDTGSGETTFFDVTLLLTGLQDLGPTFSGLPGGFLLQQLAGTGGVVVSSTDLGGGSTPLLVATIADATIAGIENAQVGSVLSVSLVYTGGALLTEAGFSPGDIGQLSIALADIESGLTLDSSGQLNAFSADATGLFTIIPEPSTVLLLLAGGSLIAMRRRDA